MYERHELEQYFFDDATLSHLASFISRYERPCCLCAPLVGRALEHRGQSARILDIDERFQELKGFTRYDIFRPAWLDDRFDVIICDPPFFRISLAQLFKTIRLLSHHDFQQPLLISYLTRRGVHITGTFARFGLEPTGYRPGYRTVQSLERNEVELFGNLGPATHAALRGERG